MISSRSRENLKKHTYPLYGFLVVFGRFWSISLSSYFYVFSWSRKKYDETQMFSEIREKILSRNVQYISWTCLVYPPGLHNQELFHQKNTKNHKKTCKKMVSILRISLDLETFRKRSLYRSKWEAKFYLKLPHPRPDLLKGTNWSCKHKLVEWPNFWPTTAV